MTHSTQTSQPEAPVPDATFGVVYEDPYLLVVDKPAGVVVHPARGHRAGISPLGSINSPTAWHHRCAK